MKNIFFKLTIIFLLNSCSYTTTEDFKVGQMYECGYNPYTRDTIVITSIREEYFQFYSKKRKSIITDNLYQLWYDVEYGKSKKIK